MTYLIPGTLVLAWATAFFEPPVEAPSSSARPIEFALLGEDNLARLDLQVEVDEVPIATLWDRTFARLFAFFDRNGDGRHDEAEAARLPSPLALRHAMGHGFTPPIGAPPEFSALDDDHDGKVTPDEVATFYREAGVATVQVGVGRLPGSAALSAALLKALDSNGDGKVTEDEWKTADGILGKLDANDDELVGAGELVPKLVYPGAAGTLILTPAAPGTSPPEVLAKLPLLLFPENPKDRRWADEVARRFPRFSAAKLVEWRTQEPNACWRVQLSDKPSLDRFSLTGDRVQLSGWVANGKLADSSRATRRVFTAQWENSATERPAAAGNRRSADLAWLTAIADRNGNGKLDRDELDAWLDLQSEIARGQVMMTVLDDAGLFELLDASHDGALSPRELRTAWKRLQEVAGVTTSTFDVASLPRGILAVVSRGYPQTLAVHQRRGPAWFQAMDRNGDGDVSRREFSGSAEQFDKLDQDKDGLIGADEAGLIAGKK